MLTTRQLKSDGLNPGLCIYLTGTAFFSLVYPPQFDMRPKFNSVLVCSGYIWYYLQARILILFVLLDTVKQVYIISMSSVFKDAESLACSRDGMELQTEITEIEKYDSSLKIEYGRKLFFLFFLT